MCATTNRWCKAFVSGLSDDCRDAGVIWFRRHGLLQLPGAQDQVPLPNRQAKLAIGRAYAARVFTFIVMRRLARLVTAESRRASRLAH